MTIVDGLSQLRYGLASTILVVVMLQAAVKLQKAFSATASEADIKQRKITQALGDELSRICDGEEKREELERKLNRKKEKVLQITDELIQTLHQTKDPEIIKIILAVLKSLGKTETGAKFLGDRQGLVKLLLNVATNANIDIREAAFGVLTNITHAQENDRFVNRPEVLSTVVELAKARETTKLTRCALIILNNLMNRRQTALDILDQWPSVLDFYLASVSKENPENLRNAAFDGIWTQTDNAEFAAAYAERNLLNALRDQPISCKRTTAILMNMAIMSQESRRVLLKDIGMVYYLVLASVKKPDIGKENDMAGIDKEAILAWESERTARTFAELALLALLGSNQQLSSQLPCINEDIFEVVLQVLSASLKGEYFNGNSWQPIHALLPLRFLSTLKRNREKVELTKWLPQAVEVLKRVFDSDEINDSIRSGSVISRAEGADYSARELMNVVAMTCEAALECISQYSMDDENRGKIQSPEIRFIVERLSVEKAYVRGWGSVVHLANSLKFAWSSTAREEDDELRAKSPSWLSTMLQFANSLKLAWTSTSRDTEGNRKSKSRAPDRVFVMISYSWGNSPHMKDIACQLHEFLEKHNFEVWRDVSSAKGDLFSGIAKAIRRSKYVFVLLSSDYRESSVCQRELKYAFEHSKIVIPLVAEQGYDPKNDDHGFFIAGQYYYDVSDAQKRAGVFSTMMANELSGT